MDRFVAAIRRHSLLSYFSVAYGISLGAVLILVRTSGLRSGELEMSRGVLVWLAWPDASDSHQT
jgi:hypothetical protein